MSSPEWARRKVLTAQTPPFLLQRMCPAVLLPKERDRALEAMIYEQIFLLVPVEMRVPGWAGQGKDRDIPCQQTVWEGPGGKDDLLGGYLGQGMSLAQWCQASVSAWELQVTQPMSWWCFTCTGQGRSGQFFGMGTGLSRLPFPSGGRCPAGKQSRDPTAWAGCVPGN